MKKQLFIFLLGSLVIHLSAQEDPQAKTILDKVSVKNTHYKTIKADFKYTVSSIQTQEPSRSESGKIILKGDKYHLQLTTTDILSDGKDVYTYLKGPNEMNIIKVESGKKDQGSFFLSNPRDIFKAYQDFKPKLVKETMAGSTLCYEIDLYPINLKTAPYSRIRMHIEKASLQIVDMKLFQKDGTQFLLELSSFQPNTEITDQEFEFDRKKYPKTQVNDMRF